MSYSTPKPDAAGRRRRICVIGAGLSGMAFLCRWRRMQEEAGDHDHHRDEVVCYEKQSHWGGQWNFSWRTALDDYLEPVHGSVYHGLFSNIPKELMEFSDYTYDEHFGRAVPSYLPRRVFVDYFEARWKKYNLKQLVRLNHNVKAVNHNPETNLFTVVVKEGYEGEEREELFDYVIVATGHYSLPNVPEYPGFDSFPGEIVHSHHVRSFKCFKDQNVLIVGAMLSAEDAFVNTMKQGARDVVITYRSNEPTFIKEADRRKGLEKIEGSVATFQDGSTFRADSIILCTGYYNSYPYLKGDLAWGPAPCHFYPRHFYKCMTWLKGGNGKLFYIGLPHHALVNVFEVQSLWINKVIRGDITLPPREKMLEDAEGWFNKMEQILADNNIPGQLNFQNEYLADVNAQAGHPHDMSVAGYLGGSFKDRADYGAFDYRNRAFKSTFTGTLATEPKVPYMEAFYETTEDFLKLNL